MTVETLDAHLTGLCPKQPHMTIFLSLDITVRQKKKKKKAD